MNDYTPTEPLRFKIVRAQDDGTLKHVADGVRWTDNSVSVHWLGEHSSTVFWPALANAAAIHRADGKTQFVFTDHWVPADKACVCAEVAV